MPDARHLHDEQQPPEKEPRAIPPKRPRMTRKEIWSQIGVSAAAWVMLFALARGWWRVYLAASQ